jgi:hypothetical protein
MISESRCEQSGAFGDRGCLHPGTDAELAQDVGDVHARGFVPMHNTTPISASVLPSAISRSTASFRSVNPNFGGVGSCLVAQPSA